MTIYQRTTTVKIKGTTWKSHSRTVWVTVTTGIALKTIYKSFRIIKLIRS